MNPIGTPSELYNNALLFPTTTRPLLGLFMLKSFVDMSGTELLKNGLTLK